jgi:hypothetical protein
MRVQLPYQRMTNIHKKHTFYIDILWIRPQLPHYRVTNTHKKHNTEIKYTLHIQIYFM